MRTPVVPALRGLLLVALSGTVVGCSFSVDVGGLSSSQLTESLSEQMGERAGEPLESAHCGSGLAAEVGDTTTCTVAANGVNADVDVVVTGIEGERVDYRWEVAEGTQVMRQEAVRSVIEPSVRAQTGFSLASLECPGGQVSGPAGTETTCRVQAPDGTAGDIVITVESVAGLGVEVGWRPPDGAGEPQASGTAPR